MERLKSRSDGGRDGESQLVTREDGTQVYRVRKRKRRTHQPKKELEAKRRRVRVLQVIAAVSLVALTGAAFLGSLIYLNSSGYREKIVDRIRVWTGAEVSVAEFRATPVSVGAASIQLEWPEGTALRSLKLHGLEGALRPSSVFSGQWSGSEILAANGGTLVIDKPSGSAPAFPAREGDCPFQFRYRAPKFNILIGGSEKPVARVSGSEASLVTLSADASKANLQIEGGQLSLGTWGNFALDFGSLQIEEGNLRLGNLRLTPKDSKNGEISILNPSSALVDLSGDPTPYELRVSSVPMSLIGGSGLGNLLVAEISGLSDGPGGTLTFAARGGSGISIRLPFRALPAAVAPVASGLPFFETLAEGMRNPWYRKPRFDLEASGVLFRDDSVSRIDELQLEARGYLALAGSIAVHADGRLEGMIDVGLPEAAVENASFAYRRTFGRRDKGIAWATVRVSGTREKPEDNLAALLEGTASHQAPVQERDLEDEFEDLTRPGR